jgi:SNF2 family DNA or RNA helicase
MEFSWIVCLSVLIVTHKQRFLSLDRTLMQNNHKELWNLVDLVQQDYFGTKEEFNTFVANPIALGR